MQLFKLLGASLFAVSTLAHIDGMTAPATVQVGKTVTVTLQTTNSLINYADDFIIFGYVSGSGCVNCLGNPVASFDLITQGHSGGPVGSFTETIPAPSTAGTYTLTAVITSVVGVNYGTQLRQFNASVTAH